MMDPKRWINTLPSTIKSESDKQNYNLNSEKWTETIPIPKKNNQTKKYSFTIILFVVGLVFVSMIKNETRNLQKEINKLKASINILKSNLHQSILDHNVITSPENIAILAKEHLEPNFSSYKKSQIKNLNEGDKVAKNSKKEKKLIEKIPVAVKKKLANKMNSKKEDLKQLYAEAKDIKKGSLITSPRVQQWAAVQIVKGLLGIPIIPGR